TSPTRISLSVILLLPSISILYGPPALLGDKIIFHTPSFAVVVLYFLLLNLTVTFSLGVAQPQIFIGSSLCKTIPLLTISGNFTCALDGIESIRVKNKRSAFLMS